MIDDGHNYTCKVTADKNNYPSKNYIILNGTKGATFLSMPVSLLFVIDVKLYVSYISQKCNICIINASFTYL